MPLLFFLVWVFERVTYNVLCLIRSRILKAPFFGTQARPLPPQIFDAAKFFEEWLRTVMASALRVDPSNDALCAGLRQHLVDRFQAVPNRWRDRDERLRSRASVAPPADAQDFEVELSQGLGSLGMFPGESFFSQFASAEQPEASVDGQPPDDLAPGEPPVVAVDAGAPETVGQPEAAAAVEAVLSVDVVRGEARDDPIVCTSDVAVPPPPSVSVLRPAPPLRVIGTAPVQLDAAPARAAPAVLVSGAPGSNPRPGVRVGHHNSAASSVRSSAPPVPLASRNTGAVARTYSEVVAAVFPPAAHVLPTLVAQSSAQQRSEEELLRGIDALAKLRADLSDQQRKGLQDTLVDGKNLYLYGVAGAGKSTLLTRITDGLREVYGEDAVLVTASTAVAASHIDGVTLHSAVGAGHGPMDGDRLFQQCGRRQGLLDRLRSTRALVIDEISQVSSVTFNAVQRLFQLVKGNSLPMGGVQLVTCGDFLQLPPVTPTGYCGSRVPLAFESGAWAAAAFVFCHLTVVFRQGDGQQDFRDRLARVRRGDMDSGLVSHIMSTADHRVDSAGSMATRAYGTNGECYLHNGIILATLPGPITRREAVDELVNGGTAEYLEQLCPVPRLLQFKAGAEVMLRKNISRERRLHNGAKCVISSEQPADPGRVRVDVCTGPGQFVTEELGMMTFEVFHPHTQELIGSRTQFPFHLAYAVTVHKLQGLEVRAPHPCPHTLQSHGRTRISTRLTLDRPCSWTSCGWTAPRFAMRASSTPPCRGSRRGRVSA